jgi:Ca-activated chloride channel family protein
MGRLFALAVVNTLAVQLYGQTAAPPLFRSDVKLVRLLATVKNTQGQLVGGLEQNDFSISDSGVKQQIAVFERYTEQTLSVALLLDTSASIAKDLKIAVASMKRFLQALIQEGNPRDEAALFAFNHEVSQQTGFTRRISQIERRITPLKAEAGTSLYDAIWFASRALEKREGRHVLVIVTDGGDTTSTYRYHDALRAAHIADAPIYSLLLMPITNDAGRNIGGENALTTLGQSTGGRLFTPAPGPEIDHALSEILRDLRTQYLIGYYPKNLPVSKEKFHSIRLDLARPDLRATTRTGYYE